MIDKWAGLATNYKQVTIPAGGIVQALSANSQRIMLTITAVGPGGAQFAMGQFSPAPALTNQIRARQSFPFAAGGDNTPRTAIYSDYGQLMQLNITAQGGVGTVIHAFEVSANCQDTNNAPSWLKNRPLSYRIFDYSFDNLGPSTLQLLPSNPMRVGLQFIGSAPGFPRPTFNWGEPKTNNGQFTRFSTFSDNYNWSLMGDMIFESLFIGRGVSAGAYAEIFAA